MESVGLHEEWPWKSGLVRELERGTGSVKEVLVEAWRSENWFFRGDFGSFF